jgi:signal peptidase II
VSGPWRNRAIGLALAAAIYLLDQWIKGLVTGPWNLREVGVIDLLPFFDLRWTQNFGVSLGMFEATSPEMRWGLVALTGLIAAVVFVWMLRERSLFEITGLGLILGGALGNIRDRFELGYVIDYADLHFSWIPPYLCPNYENGVCRPFLIFNVADAAITIGVLIILARALFMREKPAAAQDENVADQTAENSTNA